MTSPMDTPGSQALEVARSSDNLSIFKKPIGFAKRSSFKAKVLEEDLYVHKMGIIIERDFFPDLEKLKAQNEYLEALEHNDAKKMHQLYAKYSFGRPVTDRPVSPATFETPVRRDGASTSEPQHSDTWSDTASVIEDPAEEDEINSLCLDQYLSRYTSEDDASFQEIMAEAEKRHKLKHAWLYKNEQKNASEKTEPLSIENASNSKWGQLDTWAYTNKNYIMYIPDGVELTKEEQIEMAKKRQRVMYKNTRLAVNPYNEQQNKETMNKLAKSQSRLSDGKIGIDGKEIVHNVPSVNGFNFVATPSPMPGECESPLMTWGQIEGTPFRLDGGDTPLLRSGQGPSFRMAEPPRREEIAMRLAEKAGKRHRDKKNRALEVARRSFATPSPRSNIDRLNTMSPAARRLATQKLRISATPSPRRLSSSLKQTPLIGLKTPSTPRLVGTLPKNNASGSGQVAVSDGPVLTDNLLNLPRQRQRASDSLQVDQKL